MITFAFTVLRLVPFSLHTTDIKLVSVPIGTVNDPTRRNPHFGVASPVPNVPEDNIHCDYGTASFVHGVCPIL